MQLQIIPGTFVVCKIPDATRANLNDDFYFLSRTDEELSLVCREESIPDNHTETESGWNMFRVSGILDFSLTGILSNLAGILAQANVGIFAVSTYNTDYILLKAENLPRAMDALRSAGHTFI